MRAGSGVGTFGADADDGLPLAGGFDAADSGDEDESIGSFMGATIIGELVSHLSIPARISFFRYHAGMLGLLHDFLLIFIPLFVVVDAAGTIPVYLALTSHYSEATRRRIAVRATVVASVTGLLFIVLGQAVLRFLGLRFEDLQIAGGVLLVVLAVKELLASSKSEAGESPDAGDGAAGIVPLAVPIIVGPATMTTSLLLVNTYSKNYTQHGAIVAQVIVSAMVGIALLLNLGILLVGMWHSKRITALVGRNTMEVVNKIVMILIAAIAVSLIRQGIQGIMTGPGR